MSEMIERGAIALFCSEIGGEGWPADLPEKAKDHFRKRARAVIEAMREPTQQMLDAVVDGIDAEDQQLATAYRTMIGAALK